MSNFKVGDRVRINTKQQYCPAGVVGTVVGFCSTTYVAIKFDRKYPWAHTCESLTPDGYGYWIYTANLTKLSDSEQTNPYEFIINKIKYLDQRFKDRKNNHVQDW